MKYQVWWEERSVGERLALAIGIPLFIVSLFVAAFFAFKPAYEVLFSGLAGPDIGKIANQLTHEGIHYKVDEEGGRILVPKAQVHDARIRVMEAGIPLNQPIGFELFDNVDFGMTEFTQRINYQRALEGELTRTIAALREVERARLHLVLPEERLFNTDGTEPKAALTLAIKPNMSLSPERISGIRRLIASSVPGLAPEAVAIHDDKGASLVAEQTGSSVVGAVNARVDAKKAVESYLTQKARAVLDRSFGVGNAGVEIDVDLEHDQRQIVREGYSPNSVTTGWPSLRGVFGEPEITDAKEETQDPAYLNTDEMPAGLGYETGRQQETIAIATGALKRMTVSVLIPITATEDVRRAVSTAVGNAIGINVERGDTLSITAVPAPAKKVDQKTVPSGPLVLNSVDADRPWYAIFDLPLILMALGGAGLGSVLCFTVMQLVRPRPLTEAELHELRTQLRAWVDEGGAS